MDASKLLVLEYPSASWLASAQDSALFGLRTIVVSSIRVISVTTYGKLLINNSYVTHKYY